MCTVTYVLLSFLHSYLGFQSIICVPCEPLPIRINIHAMCPTRRMNLALVLHLCVMVSCGLLMHVCFCRSNFHIFSTTLSNWLGKRTLFLCPVEYKTSTQSVIVSYYLFLPLSIYLLFPSGLTTLPFPFIESSVRIQKQRCKFVVSLSGMWLCSGCM